MSADIHSDAYRPWNVHVVPAEQIDARWASPSTRWIVVDFDGTPMQGFANRADAEARCRSRRGVIKAALSRRANKARRAAL